jgi:UDP-N-acetylglucosamine 1-carboxyvinyltransferase
MDRFKIHGGIKLEGEVRISGAKNAALPAMAASLLTPEAVHLKNIPHVRDIITMAKLLAHMRCKVESPDIPPSEFIIRAETISHAEAPYELVKTMRASVLTLGPLVARFGYARVSLPGGCSIRDFRRSRIRGSKGEPAAWNDIPLPENYGHGNREHSHRGGAGGR